MKTIQMVLACAFLVLAGSPSLSAQDLMESLMQTAEQHNEANGNSNNGNADGELTPQQEEWQAQWEAEWEAQQNAEILSSLDTKYLKCMGLMIMYVYNYLILVDEHRIGDITMSECDAYGMQTLALASSTTIMYCPEGMSELSDGDLSSIGEDFLQAAREWNRNHTDHEDYDLVHPLYQKLEYIWFHLLRESEAQNVGEDFTDSRFEVIIKYLIEFFKPGYILPRTLEIGREMEALGCSG